MSAQEFQNQRAVNVMVGGRYSLANWYDHHGNRREFACRTSRVSPFRMLVSVPVIGKVGERVVSYFGDFGKLDGWIADTVAGGFLIDLETDKAQREKLARKLTWLEKKQKDPSLIEAREQRTHRSEEPALDGDLRRRHLPRLLHHRHVGVRRGGVRRRPARSRHAAGDRLVRRARGAAFPRGLRGQVRRDAGRSADREAGRAADPAAPAAEPDAARGAPRTGHGWCWRCELSSSSSVPDAQRRGRLEDGGTLQTRAMLRDAPAAERAHHDGC